MTFSSKPALSLQQAVDSAPTLARLARMASESSARLAVVRPLLPAGLRDLVKPGLAEADAWCLLVPHNAAASKLRQLAPALLARLQAHGYALQSIRIKVERGL